MNITVTGGSGRLGAFVIPQLVESGHKVVIADISEVSGQLVNLGVDHRQRDLLNEPDMISVLEGADAVIHLACLPNHIEYSGDDTFEVNTRLTENMLTACQKLQIRQIIFASSVNAIGADFLSEPIRPGYFPIDENHLSRATDQYSRSKWECEKMLENFSLNSEVQIASLRLHGVWDEARCIYHCRDVDKKNPFNGAERGFWGWVHGKDAARAFLLALDSNWKGHQVINIHADETILDIPTTEAIERVYGECRFLEPLEGCQSPISLSRARQILGWRSEICWREYY